jgi:ribosome maturation factor RimP
MSINVKQLITDIANNWLTNRPELFLVDVIVTGTEAKPKVMVLIDGDEGINIDQCAELSREVSARVEEQDEVFAGAWRLEVSSPGIEHPLTIARQYPKHIGRRLRVNTTAGKELRGPLAEIKEDGLVVKEEKKVKKKVEHEEVFIPFQDIKTVHVLVTF